MNLLTTFLKKRPTVLLVLILSAFALPLSASTTPTNPEQIEQLSYFEALVLGLVEGLTEYLPVSSTGHLLLTQHILGLTDTPQKKGSADAYAIIIQFGAILAVLGLYRQRTRQILHGFLGKNPEGLNIGLSIGLAFIPAAILGLLFQNVIKEYLFGPWPVIGAWIVGGLVIFMVPGEPDRKSRITPKPIEAINFRMAAIIGLFQIFALCPGVSRSLSTILGALIAGLSLGAAVEFSFLLGLITLGAATVYEFAGSGVDMLAHYGIAAPLIGILSAFISAWVSIKWMVNYLKSRGLRIFGYYRILLGLSTAILLLTGII